MGFVVWGDAGQAVDLVPSQVSIHFNKTFRMGFVQLKVSWIRRFPTSKGGELWFFSFFFVCTYLSMLQVSERLWLDKNLLNWSWSSRSSTHCKNTPNTPFNSRDQRNWNVHILRAIFQNYSRLKLWLWSQRMNRTAHEKPQITGSLTLWVVFVQALCHFNGQADWVMCNYFLSIVLWRYIVDKVCLENIQLKSMVPCLSLFVFDWNSAERMLTLVQRKIVTISICKYLYLFLVGIPSKLQSLSSGCCWVLANTAPFVRCNVLVVDTWPGVPWTKQKLCVGPVPRIFRCGGVGNDWSEVQIYRKVGDFASCAASTQDEVTSPRSLQPRQAHWRGHRCRQQTAEEMQKWRQTRHQVRKTCDFGGLLVEVASNPRTNGSIGRYFVCSRYLQFEGQLVLEAQLMQRDGHLGSLGTW